MILNLLLSIQMICRMFTKILINNKKLNSVVTKLFIRGTRLNMALVFITQSYFKVAKDVRLNPTHFFIMKIPNKREFQHIAQNHSSDLNCKDFIMIYKKCTAEPYSFLVNDATLASDNPLRFRKYIIKIMTINEIRDEKLQYDTNRKLPKYQPYHQAKLISMNILLVKKYYHLINNK